MPNERTAILKELEHEDPLQKVLAGTWLYRDATIHTHTCQGCDVELTCVCGDRRERDRLTGRRRLFYCLSCQDLKQDLEKIDVQLDLDQFT